MSRLDELEHRIESRDAQVGVIGLGYVGLPLAVEFAGAGFTVVGFDLDPQKVEAIGRGESYIEDVPAEAVAQAAEAGRLSATTDFNLLSRCDVINVCVPTPLTKSKDPDVSHMARALEEITKRARTGQLVVVGSTTYPGTTHELFVPMLESSGLRVGEDIAVAFAPERIDPANQHFRVREVPKVVGGETPRCTDLARRVFETVFDTVVPVSSTQSAEMVKLLENTFRAINIGLANEVALMCDRLGLDVWEVIDAAATKPYGFMKFQPGPGLGGHCIPVDPTYLAWKMKSLNFPARFIELATEINGQMPEHVVEKIAAILNDARIAVNGARVLILGVAYKADVGDMRESPAIDIIRMLAQRGGEISYHDPHVAELIVDGSSYKCSDLTDDLLERADVAVILTDHEEVDYARVVARSSRIFDTRNSTRRVSEGVEKIRKL
ncbi:MAG: nucleotide sugar dehydrogenase [Myxococcota bacterium]|nr:nucleotide sugar dehydrogenase [Myxococcota bacterium]